MKKYKEYMDTIKASDTLHQKLVGLEEPGKRPIPWKQYGSLAAALALVLGVGAVGMSGGLGALAENFRPAATTIPEIADAFQPDIAPEDPDAAHEPGEKTIGGYEVVSGSGPNAMVSYYVLPRIEYGVPKEQAQMCLDWDIAKGATRRDLTQEEITAMMGGEDAVDAHLNWGEYELTGWAAWYEDGSFWGAYLQGHQGPLDHFEFAVTADQLPPTCIAYAESVTQEVRGLTITADGHDSVASEQGGVDASTRRVSFMKDNYGYRFDITGVSRALTEERVSRLVARIADKGLGLSTASASLTLPVYTCPDCGETFPLEELKAHIHSFGDSASTEPYDPNEAADPSYNAPAESEICGLPLAPSADICKTCGKSVPENSIHFHLIPNGDGTFTCDSCGVTLLEGKKHYHNTADDAMCSGYPVPEGGETHTCPICGKVLPAGMEHSHEVCGLPLAPEGWTGPDEEGPDVIAETIYCD